MNELAQAVHDLVNGNENCDTDRLYRLTPQEQAALVEFEPLLRSSPADLAALLAQEGPTAVWFGPVPVASRSAA
ncbi:MAG: hypothetical protein M1132_13670 [Chloroflexi bacterium]|nr:hypothetical protein [Chloroflexota bacterium]